MLAAIPYTTFPELPSIPVLDVQLRTFGLLVALGVIAGAWVAATYGERFGVHRDETYRTGLYLVVAGLAGSRITWVVTHVEEIDNPVDVVAVWQGGIQFAGGFLAALAVGLPIVRRWDRVQRGNVLNGYALGLAVGVAIGRLGCYAVGEHFGRETGFFLGTRYAGGALVEDTLGDTPLQEGIVFHNTSLYELVHLLALSGLMLFLISRARRAGTEVAPGLLVGLFLIWYAVLRFGTDTLRVNDERVLQMTGAQWMALAMLPLGLYVLLKLSPQLAREAEESAGKGTVAALLADGDDDETIPVPDEVEPPEDDDDLSYVSED